MADNFGVYNLTGRVEPVISSSLETALQPVSGNINIRRLPERHLRDLVEFDLQDESFAKIRNSFVIAELSSSQHEVTSRNAYLSGTEQLEFTDVPASGAVYYSKTNRLRQLTYKLSASADLPIVPGNTRQPSTIENVARGTFHSVSGSYRNNSYFDPAVFTIDVPEYGKIRDVKVWVELVHDHRGGTGPCLTASSPFYGGGSGTLANDLKHGLQGLQIALRSPNTNFKYSHPLWNDPTTFAFEKRPDSVVDARFKGVPDLLKNSYLLWGGHSLESDLGITLGSLTSSSPSEYVLNIVVTGSFTDQLTYPSMQVDKDDQPVIIFDMPFESKMMIRRSYFDGFSLLFAKEMVTSTFNVAGMTLLLGSDKRTPHILFTENGNSSVRYIRSSSAGWVGPDVVTPCSNQLAHDFAVDSHDKVMIFSRADDFIPSIFVSSSVTGWVRNKVGKNSAYFYFHSIQVDSNDVFHFSYLDHDDLGDWVFYGTTGSAGLTIEKAALVDFTLSTNPFVALALNSRNEPTIAIGANENGIRLITSGTNGWSSKVHFDNILFSPKFFPKNAVFDGNDDLHIITDMYTYRGVNNFDLGMVRSGSNGMSLEPVVDRSVITSNAGYPDRSIDFDSVGNLHIMHNEASVSGVFGSIHHLKKNFHSYRDAAYYEYDTDIDMRTVFTDSSLVSNPRHLEDSYESSTSVSPGPSSIQVERARKEGSYPSPTSASVKLFNYGYLDTPYFQSAWMSGANFPWILDSRIPPGNFHGRNFSATSSLNIPIPPGWLSGPAFTPMAGEFPTSGSQIGPANIQPVYPLLDDVFAEKVVRQSSLTSTPALDSFSKKIVGFRPGLRGTEINGKWQLLIGNNADYIAGNMTGSLRGGYWFRQFRIEFLVDQGEDDQYKTMPSRAFKYKKPGYVTGRAGRRLFHTVSGSAAWDIGVNNIFTIQRDEYGRSVGITNVTGSTQFAVFSQLTGALPTILSASGLYDQVQSTYLSNEFGTPYVPITSGSAEIPSFDVFDIDEAKKSRLVFDQVLNPKTLIPKDNTLRASLARADIVKSTRDFILTKIGKG